MPRGGTSRSAGRDDLAVVGEDAEIGLEGDGSPRPPPARGAAPA